MVRVFFLKYHDSEEDIKYASYEIYLVVMGKKMKQRKKRNIWI